MPVEAEPSRHRPHLVPVGRNLDGLVYGLELYVRLSEVRKHVHAGFRRAGRAALEELAIMVDEPGQQDVDRVRVDGAPAACPVRTAGERALLDLEVARVRDRLRDVEQQEVVEKDPR